MRHADAAGFRSSADARTVWSLPLLALGASLVGASGVVDGRPWVLVACAIGMAGLTWWFVTNLTGLARRLDEGTMYRRLVEGIPVVIYVDAADDAGSAMYISPQIAELTGYSVDDWFSSPDFFLDILHPEDRARLEREIAFNNAGHRNRSEYRVIARDGSVIWFYDESTPERDAEGRVVCTRGCMIDVTERRRAQSELAAVQRQHERLLAELPLTVYVDRPDPSCSNLFVSAQVEELTGYRPEEFAADPDLYLSIVHPDDRALVSADVDSALGGNRFRREYRINHRDGREVWVLDDAAPELDDDGRVVAIRGFLIDTTELRQAADALAAKEAELRQSQKMEALGRIAGGIAHDFNNLLTVIGGNVAMLLESGDLAELSRGDLEEVAGAADRAAALTRQLLAFSRRQVLQPTVLDLSAVVRDFAPILIRSVGEGIVVNTELDPAAGSVLVERSQIEQVVLNLVVNARDAMPGGGAVTISVCPGPSGSVELTVTDTGEGIAPEARDHIFEPFFTTKALGVGTGLGLATVVGIVEQSGGTIAVHDGPVRGTRFVISFPAAAPVIEQRNDNVTAGERLVGRILVVEDEPAVRSLVVRSLRGAGHDVVATAGVHEACQAIDVAGPFDLVLSDVVLAGRSGREVVEHAMDRDPSVRFLYMSGYTDDEVVRRGVSACDVPLLDKPFTPEELLSKLDDVLNPARR